MQDQTLLIVLGACGFVVNVIVLAVGGTWALARTAASINKQIATHRMEIDAEFATMRKEFGETAAAIRAKVTEVELWSRDNFVKRGSFEQAMERMEKNVASLGDRIEARLLRMEGKLDSQAARERE